MEGNGFTVWWDTNLTSGEIFREVIDRELDAAGAIAHPVDRIPRQSVALSEFASAFSDSAFAYLHYQRPGAIDVGYTLSYVLMAIAAMAPEPRRARERGVPLAG